MEIELGSEDITTARVDAVVNVANHPLWGGGGVDGGGDLPATYVIHVVGPNWTAGQRDPVLLESCYRNALRIADELGVRTMTLPAVSAGIYGWHRESAAEIALTTLRATPTSVERAVFCLIEPRIHSAFTKAFGVQK